MFTAQQQKRQDLKPNKLAEFLTNTKRKQRNHKIQLEKRVKQFQFNDLEQQIDQYNDYNYQSVQMLYQQQQNEQYIMFQNQRIQQQCQQLQMQQNIFQQQENNPLINQQQQNIIQQNTFQRQNQSKDIPTINNYLIQKNKQPTRQFQLETNDLYQLQTNEKPKPKAKQIEQVNFHQRQIQQVNLPQRSFNNQSILERITNNSTQNFMDESQQQNISRLFDKEQRSVCIYNANKKLVQIYHWKIIKTLGQGGFGTVFLGKSINEDKDKQFHYVGVKEIEQGEYDQQFLDNEIKIQYKFSGCKYVVNLLKAFKYKQKYLLVMEYLPFNLQQYVNKGQCSLFDKLRLFQKVVKGVKVLHKNGFIHADLKPENILLNHQLKVKLCDFSLAQKLDENGQVFSRNKFGSMDYMHPSLFSGKSMAVYTKYNDYWALGVIFHLLIFGVHPYRNMIDNKSFKFINDYEPKDNYNYQQLVKKEEYKKFIFPIAQKLLKVKNNMQNIDQCFVLLQSLKSTMKIDEKQKDLKNQFQIKQQPIVQNQFGKLLVDKKDFEDIKVERQDFRPKSNNTQNIFLFKVNDKTYNMKRERKELREEIQYNDGQFQELTRLITGVVIITIGLIIKQMI